MCVSVRSREIRVILPTTPDASFIANQQHWAERFSKDI